MMTAEGITMYGTKPYSSEITALCSSDIRAHAASITRAVMRTANAAALPKKGIPESGMNIADTARKKPEIGVMSIFESGAARDIPPNILHITGSVKQFAARPVMRSDSALSQNFLARVAIFPCAGFFSFLFWTKAGRKTVMPKVAAKESIKPASMIASGETVSISSAARKTELTPSLSAPEK